MKTKLLKLLSIIFTIALCLGVVACGNTGDEPQHVHSYTLLKYDATSHWNECDCGEKQNVVAHSGGTATCTEKAKCQDCNQTYGEFAHEYNEVATDPTCEDEGFTTYTCACGDTYVGNYVQPLGHNYSEEVTNPTCEDKGFTTYTCNCGDSYVDNYVDPLEHNYSAWLPNGNDTHSKFCFNNNAHVITEDCRGGVATEEDQAICEVCDGRYGNLLPHTHCYETLKYDNINHWKECRCGDVDAVEEHKGGTATQSERAICEVCEIPYGSVLPYKRDGNYIYMGKYPQTIKADNVTLSKYTNSNGYYDGSDGAEYLKVIASCNAYYGNAFSNGVEITKGDVYYFKMEPIRWRILDEEKGLLVCDFIIDTVQYNHSSFSHSNGSYANNYKESKVRAWLNNEFLKTAFTLEEQSFIKTTLVDNSAESTLITENNKFVCEDTLDKIFLLSAVEANAMIINTDAYFPAERRLITSDYSRVTGAYVDTYSNYGCGYWWLRSPYAKSSCKVRFIRSNGRMENFDVHLNDVGVVPALQIKL